MNRSITSALCLIAVCAAALSPAVAVAADEPVVAPTTTTVPTGTTGAVPTTSTDTEGLTLSQDQIDALQSETAGGTDDRSVFQKASDFVSDHAPFFIIGIVVLAAILAGIFISRGRRRTGPAAPAAAAGAVAGTGAVAATGVAAGSAPASVPSAKELRRRKRATAQQAREDERRRRKAGYDGRKPSAPAPVQTTAGPPVPAPAASPALDPVEAEKRAAKGLPPVAPPRTAAPIAQSPVSPAPAAAGGAAAASAAPLATGAIPAPVSPSQTAPAAGIQIPAPATAPVPDDTTYVKSPGAVAEPAAEAAHEPEPPTQVQQVAEPEVVAPGPDAKVGEAAAAFAAGAVGGGIAAKAASGNDEARQGQAPAAGEPAVAVPDPGEAEAERRLRAKVEEIKAGQPNRADEEAKQDLMRKRSEAEAVQLEIDELRPSPVSAAGLEGVERRLEENRQHRDEALELAEARLRRIEERAEQAERRAAFAERLTRLNLEESEREQRLNDVLSGIDRAEERTREAEMRAAAAERAAAAALEGQSLSAPVPPEPDLPPPAEAFPEHLSAGPDTFHETKPAAPVDAGVEAAPLLPPEKKPAFGDAPAKTPANPGSPFSRLFSSETKSSGLNLNTATFEELREADLSVTQATRILAYRERFGGYSSIEDLEKVPGFPEDVIESLRDKITV